MQFHNDIFDTYRDQQEGIHTLPGSLITHRQLQQLYADHRSEMERHIINLPLKRANKHRFLLLANLALETGQICLNMYAQLDQDMDAVFDPSRYSRKQLVCDMDRLPHIARTVFNTLRRRY